MLRIFARFFGWVCTITLLWLAVAVLRTGFNPLRTREGWEYLFDSPVLWAAVAGLGTRLLLTSLRGQNRGFLDNLEHELTHAVTGYLTFSPPISLTATHREGGKVYWQRGGNPITFLSPYFLPLYATVIALVTLVMKRDLLPYGRYAVGFLLGSFVYRSIWDYRTNREYHISQTDFGQYGFIFSLAFVAALLPLSVAGLLEAAGLWHFPWHDGIWPTFVEPGYWVGRMISGVFKMLG